MQSQCLPPALVRAGRRCGLERAFVKISPSGRPFDSTEISLATLDAGSEPSGRYARLRAALRALYHMLARTPAASLLQLPAIRRARARLIATEVSGPDVIEIVNLLEVAGAESWLFGGWGCDAVLGAQTRAHGDVDLLLSPTDHVRAVAALERQGFAVWQELHHALLEVVELVDRRRRRAVGLHFASLDPEVREGWLASLRANMSANGYAGEAVFGTGTIAGQNVRCLSAPAQLTLHTYYMPKDVDRCDVQLLCSRLRLPAPRGYENASGDA